MASQPDSTLPYSEEAERAALGCLLLEPARNIPIALSKLSGRDCFHDLRHRWVYVELLEMFEARDHIDLLTVADRLRTSSAEKFNRIGAMGGLLEFQEATPSPLNLDYYLGILVEKHDSRRLIRSCAAAIENAGSASNASDIADALLTLRNDLDALGREPVSETQLRSVSDLEAYDTTNDPSNLLGNRWVCRGGSITIVAPSGVGKSSLGAQLAASWATGQSVFGIKPVRPLKTMIVQAENDMGDLAEMLAGVRAGLGMTGEWDDDLSDLLHENLVFIEETEQTARPFCRLLERLIDEHQPDLVMIDPLLSFMGGDISRQDVCSQFLRNWLNPISKRTGVAWVMIHHTGKPPGDKGARKGWHDSDHQYVGIGSSELVNWTRAVMVLQQLSAGRFRLKLAKRGKRAGATHPDGEPTTDLYLQHAREAIFWEQLSKPEETEDDTATGGQGDGEKAVGRPSKTEEAARACRGAFLLSLTEWQSKRAIADQIAHHLANLPTGQRLVISKRTATKVADCLIKSGDLTLGADLKIRHEKKP